MMMILRVAIYSNTVSVSTYVYIHGKDRDLMTSKSSVTKEILYPYYKVSFQDNIYSAVVHQVFTLLQSSRIAEAGLLKISMQLKCLVYAEVKIAS